MPDHQQIQQSKKTNTIFQKQATPVIQTPISNPYSIIQRARINPKSLTHADIMQLQRTIGNQAVGRLLSSIGNTSTAHEAPIQRSEIPEEEEKTMQGKFETVQRSEIPEEEEPLQGKMVGTVQRQEIPEEEEPLQGKMAETIQRQELEEEEKPLQGKMIDTVQRQEIPEEEPLQTKRENNTGMPDTLKAGVESLSGIDMSDVRVQYNSSKPAEVGALAYTQGTDIHVAPGQERHLPHEAWHVVQQKQSRVKPTMQLKDGVPVNDNEGLEHEADIMGERAFTSGQDVFFRQGAYELGSRGGRELIAHELTHMVQQDVVDVKRKSDLIKSSTDLIIQRTFAPARATGKAHLRDANNLGVHKGPAIPNGASLLVNDDKDRVVEQEHRFFENTKWHPAVNVPPNHEGRVSPELKGYIRSSKVQIEDKLENYLRARIQECLQKAATSDYLDRHLNTPDHIQFLLEKALRYKGWEDAKLDDFVEALSTLHDKLVRIEEGVDYVSKALAYWKKWLDPDNPDAVKITKVNLVESDLHERGLGVVEVRFSKPAGEGNIKFRTQTDIHAFIKPENKSLEQNLLGDDPNSAASKINSIAGLVLPTEKLQTIKMESTDEFGTLVEAARGVSAEKLWPEYTYHPRGKFPIAQSFHETLVFAFLTGIDDLHRENVFWYRLNEKDPGIPTLVDADNVLSRNQMENVANGKIPQSGFGSYFNLGEAEKNKKAIMTKNNTEIHSKILEIMLHNPLKRDQIVEAIKLAIRGHHGRVVPIRTSFWGSYLESYPTLRNKDEKLDDWSKRKFLVRGPDLDGVGFDGDVGPGLFGIVGSNADEPFWNEIGEREQTKHDFDSGVIPFYEYDFDSGYVKHNGVTIYHGQTLDQAMERMLAYFH